MNVVAQSTGLFLVHHSIFQRHNGYFGDEHRVISIEVYESSPAKYKKVFCEHHSTEVLVKACKKCDRLTCVECDISEEYCSGEIK